MGDHCTSCDCGETYFTQHQHPECPHDWESIQTAALRVEGVVWTLPRPARHHVLIRAWCLAHYKDGREGRIPEHEQGFMTSMGRFVDREEAASIAFAARQIDRRKSGLVSEDLW